jgi:hypothetical protein
MIVKYSFVKLKININEISVRNFYMHFINFLQY